MKQPSPWRAYADATEGRAYYYNPGTHTSTWEFPLNNLLCEGWKRKLDCNPADRPCRPLGHEMREGSAKLGLQGAVLGAS